MLHQRHLWKIKYRNWFLPISVFLQKLTFSKLSLHFVEKMCLCALFFSIFLCDSVEKPIKEIHYYYHEALHTRFLFDYLLFVGVAGFSCRAVDCSDRVEDRWLFRWLGIVHGTLLA